MRAFGLQKVQVPFFGWFGVIPVNHFRNKQVQHGDFRQANHIFIYRHKNAGVLFGVFFLMTADKSEKLMVVALEERGQR